MATNTRAGGTVAARIEEARLSKDRNLSWLSRKTDIPRSTLRHQLVIKPELLTTDHMLRIAAALEIEPATLVEAA